jgi:hypothetical protein
MKKKIKDNMVKGLMLHGTAGDAKNAAKENAQREL